MSTLYKVCKRTIERQPRPLSAEFVADMQTKLDLYSASGKLTAEEYAELSAMLVDEEVE